MDSLNISTGERLIDKYSQTLSYFYYHYLVLFSPRPQAPSINNVQALYIHSTYSILAGGIAHVFKGSVDKKAEMSVDLFNMEKVKPTSPTGSNVIFECIGGEVYRMSIRGKGTREFFKTLREGSVIDPYESFARFRNAKFTDKHFQIPFLASIMTIIHEDETIYFRDIPSPKEFFIMIQQEFMQPKTAPK